MERRFDVNDARLPSKRPAAAADNLGGENKRLCVWALAEPLHLDLPWTNGTLSPTNLTLSTTWTPSQSLNSYPGYSNPSVNAASSDSWSVSPGPGTWAPSSGQTPQLSTTLPPPLPLGLFDLDHGRGISQPGVLIPDRTANSKAEATFSDDVTAPAHQWMSGFGDSLSTPDTHAAFTPSAALIPELVGSLGYTPETGYSGSSQVKADEVVVDESTRPTPSPSFLGPSLEDVSNSAEETVSGCSVAIPQQKQYESTGESLPAVEGGQCGTLTKTSHDVCFGVILTKIVSPTLSHEETATTLTVALLGNVLKMSFQDTRKYAGLINSESLGRLMKDFSVSLTARIPPAERQPGKKSKATENKSKKNFPSSAVEIPVRVVVHGLSTEKDAVARFLSDHDLFFQHPFPSELDGSVPYFNPHYLLKPGAEMPDLGRLSLLCGSTDRTPAEVVDDVGKARLMRVFDLAYDSGESIEAKPSPRLKTTLQRHQLSALAMMTEKESGVIDDAKFPTLWEKLPGNETDYRHRITGTRENHPLRQRGGLLADEMGLGKTLSVLSLICWFLDSSNLAKNAGDRPAETDALPHATLVVAPKSTLPGWQEQVRRHVRKGQLKTSVFHGSKRGKKSDMMHRSDVVFTTYETLRSDWQGKRLLYSKPWLRVILDEAHHIRTRSTRVFQAACAIQAEFRWCLTGTPIHNSLDDYGALVSFIGVPPFSIKSAFDSWIVSPLKRKHPGNLRNLEALVRATCLRRTKIQVGGHLSLPPRVDQVEWIDLSPPDRGLYEYFKAKTAGIASGMATQKSYRKTEDNIICLLNILRRICGHGETLLSESALRAWQERRNDSIDWQTMQKWYRKQCDRCGQDAADGSDSPDARFLCQHVLCSACLMELEDEDEEERSDIAACPICRDGTVKATAPSATPSGAELQRPPVISSNKILALVRNIREEQRPQPGGPVTKSVVFSSWVKMLDLAEHAVEKAGFSVVRIDGQKSLKQRASAISRFSENPAYTVMLATIGSAGEGIDMTAANCVHLLEPHWSPMAEAQAVDRVHRIGQSRPVKATRYVTRESVETYVQWVQNQKLELIHQSLAAGLGEEMQTDVSEQRWAKLRECLGVAGDP